MPNKLLFLVSLVLCFPASVLAQTYTSPVQLSIIHKYPEIGDTGVKIPLTGYVQKFYIALYGRNDFKSIYPNKTKLAGPNLQYIALNPGLSGPVTLSDIPPTASSPYCTPEETSYTSFSTLIGNEPGDFCRIHDSIIGRLKLDQTKKFNHDLDTITPEIWAEESWFTHYKDTNGIIHRLSGNQDRIAAGASGKYYLNHNHPDWQIYFASRALRQMTGSSTYISSGMDGIYIDNMDLGWGRYTTKPMEFASESAYVDSVYNFMQYLHTRLHTNGHNFPLYANMSFDTDDGVQWNRYDPILEGGMEEGFALNWGRGPRPSDNILKQLQQAESWQALGNHYIAVAPGNKWFDGTPGKTPSFDQQSIFSLANYLLITEGTHASFKYANTYRDLSLGQNAPSTQYYKQFYDYPEYYYQLGLPAGPKYQSSASPQIFKRDFQCGSVTVNFTSNTGTITQNLNCQTTTTDPKQIILDYLKANSPSDLNQDFKVNSVDFIISTR